MRWSFASVGVIVAGIIGIVIILLFQQITTNNESDYYLLKEITEAAMIESIDVSHYRETGELKIVREKFVENFIRRFAESTNLTGTGYTINFYDIMETPPKASILINTRLGQYKIFEDTSNYNVQNKLDAILEYVGTNNRNSNESPFVSADKPEILEYYYISTNNEDKLSIRLPDKLDAANIKNVKISDISLESLIDEGDFYEAIMSQGLYYNNYPTSLDIFYKVNYTDVERIDNLKEFSYCNYGFEGKCTGKCNCDEIPGNNDDKYWIKIKMNDKDKNDKNKIIKYKISWSYDEYKLS